MGAENVKADLSDFRIHVLFRVPACKELSRLVGELRMRLKALRVVESDRCYKKGEGEMLA